MAKTILVAGYTKTSYLQKIRSYFPGEKITLACAYTRPPKTKTKEKYLTHFDVLYNLTSPEDISRLKNDADSIDCITCTQERDMVVYIQSQVLCNKITDKQAEKYHAVINKYHFKTELQKKHPGLIPQIRVIDDTLLRNLELLSYPQVIKPSGLAGSIMVRVVNSPEEFKTFYEEFSSQMKKIAEENYDKEIEIITEKYLDGPQYAVNTYIDAEGIITFCPLIRIVTPQEFGINDAYSVLQHTTDEIVGTERKSLEQAIKQIVDYFEIRNTSAHFDCILHGGQWKFFEVGLRIGGNRQNLFEESHGMNHLYNDVLNRLGKKIEIPKQKKAVCILQKASTKHGTLQSISYTRKIEQEKPPLIREDKMAKIGTEVMPLSLGGGTITRHIISGKNHDAVIKTSRQLFDNISFELI